MYLDQKIGKCFRGLSIFSFEFFETKCPPQSSRDFSPVGFYEKN